MRAIGLTRQDIRAAPLFARPCEKWPLVAVSDETILEGVAVERDILMKAGRSRNLPPASGSTRKISISPGVAIVGI